MALTAGSHGRTWLITSTPVSESGTPRWMWHPHTSAMLINPRKWSAIRSSTTSGNAAVKRAAASSPSRRPTIRR
ncbi:hypothetical protein [Amycolatopsis thermoflava]|uniref:hypothetical protein n=1 Tax=Amycolatopsis thermoflava TaxID=84480 RepID=UPI003D7395E1